MYMSRSEETFYSCEIRMFSCGQFGNFENWAAMLIWQPRSQTTHLWALADLHAATSAVWINKTLLDKGVRLRRGKHHPLLLTASKSIEFGSMQPARRGRPSIATNAESESPGLIKGNRPRSGRTEESQPSSNDQFDGSPLWSEQHMFWGIFAFLSGC